MHYDRWQRLGDPGSAEPKRNRQHGGVCMVEGCENGYEARGYCVKHLRRVEKHGDPERVDLVMNEDPERRFRRLTTVDSDTGCWLWAGWVERNGYGRYKVHGVAFGAHRWSYERFVGPIPSGLTIDHLCRVKHCVNPDHLEPVTQAENNRRRGKTAGNTRKA